MLSDSWYYVGEFEILVFRLQQFIRPGLALITAVLLLYEEVKSVLAELITKF